MKEKKEQIECDPCDDVRERNYLNTEFSRINNRWYTVAVLFLCVNLVLPRNWPIGLFNVLLVVAVSYNLGIALYLRKTSRFSVKITLLTLYLDTLTVSIALYFSGGINSPILFVWYLSLFVAGLRLGFPGSFALQVPIALIFLCLWWNDPGMTGREGLSRLAVGLVSFTLAPLPGYVFAREQRHTLQVMADIRKDSITDRLTGLFNYSYFMDELHRELSRAERIGSHFSLIIFDLDLFKQVNDTYGHEKGNHLLKDVAAILKTNARQMDTVARYGGEEFVILMPESNGAEMEVAERIRKKIEDAEFSGIADTPISITISGGVCTYPKDARSVNELLDKADRGLYLAKMCGRNKTSYCMPMA